jgi:predicted Zn finger-like uncharacterized protein
MNHITTCPACLTRFIVGRAQLEAHQGQVKCTKCQHIFDYRQHLESAHEQTVFLGIKSLKSARLNHHLNLVIALLILVALGQSLFFTRTSISSHCPACQQTLIKFCNTLNCHVDLPKEIALISLDGAELTKDENDTEHILFNAMLTNNANYIQAYPDLALTLTDSNDQILMRKIIKPDAYLKADPKELKAGFAAGRELTLSLPLETAEPVTGFRAAAVYQ